MTPKQFRNAFIIRRIFFIIKYTLIHLTFLSKSVINFLCFRFICAIVKPTKIPASITSTEQINVPLYFLIISFIIRHTPQVCDPQHNILQYRSI